MIPAYLRPERASLDAATCTEAMLLIACSCDRSSAPAGRRSCATSAPRRRSPTTTSRDELAKLGAELKGLSVERDAALDEVKRLRNELAELQRLIEKVRKGAAAELEGKVADAKGAMGTRIAELEARVAELEDALAAAQSSAELEAQLAAERQRSTALEAELDALRAPSL